MLAERELLESRDRREPRERMERKELSDPREAAPQTTTHLATATPILSQGILRPLMYPTALLTSSLYGPDTLSSSSKETATVFLRILAALVRIFQLPKQSLLLCENCNYFRFVPDFLLTVPHLRLLSGRLPAHALHAVLKL